MDDKTDKGSSGEIWTALKLLRWITDRLAKGGSSSPRLDAELLLARAMGLDRVAVYTHFDQPLSQGELATLREMVRRRLSREPMAYILGSRGFWSLEVLTDKRALVPRPESEHLVEKALDLMKGLGSPRVVDCGCGTGALAMAMAVERPDAFLVATDSSRPALELAMANLRAQGLQGRVHLILCHLLSPLAPASLDLVVSNPPYLSDQDMANLEPEVRYEPYQALYGGPDGLDVVRELVGQARMALRPGGHFLCEIGLGQAESALAILGKRGMEPLGVIPDLAGIPRVLHGRRPE